MVFLTSYLQKNLTDLFFETYQMIISKKCPSHFAGLFQLEENPESDRIVDTFYIRTLAGTNKKLIEILEYYELNNQLPEELPHSAFIESIWDLVDQSIFKMTFRISYLSFFEKKNIHVNLIPNFNFDE